MRLSPTHPANLVLGLTIWAVWFVVLYGGLSIGCAAAPPDSAKLASTWINGAVLVFALMVGSYLLWCALRCWKASPPKVKREEGRLSRFLSNVATGLYLVAAFASLSLGIPGLILPPCA